MRPPTHPTAQPDTSCVAAAVRLAPARRPMIRPGVRRVWRSPTSLQFGVDVPAPLVIDDLDEPLTHWLRSLDGTRTTERCVADALGAGIEPVDARAALAALQHAGLVTDAAAPYPPLAGLSLADRDRLINDCLASTRCHGDPAAIATVLDARQRATVKALAGDPLGVAVVARLQGAGCAGAELVTDPEPALRSDSLVIVPANVARTLRGPVRDRSAATLVTDVGEATIGLGPLVVPGESACLTCLDLARAERDPAWPQIVAQLTGRTPPSAPHSLLHLAASLAALHLLSWLAGDGAPEVDGQVTVEARWGTAHRTACTPHPACGCGRIPGSGLTMAP